MVEANKIKTESDLADEKLNDSSLRTFEQFIDKTLDSYPLNKLDFDKIIKNAFQLEIKKLSKNNEVHDAIKQIINKLLSPLDDL